MEALMKPYLNLFLFDVDPNVQSTASTDLSDEMKTFYSKDLIKNAKPNLIHDQAAQKVNIPQGSGKVIEFRKFSKLPKVTAALTDGVTPDGSSLEVTNLTATVEQYGDYVTLSDRLITEAIDPMILNTNQLLADQAGRTGDTITRDVINGGSNKYLVPSVSSGTETAVLLRKDLVGTCLLRVKDIVNAVTRLKRMDAPKINGYYLGFIHPDLSGDLQNSEGWQEVHKYAAPEEIFAGELGRIGGVRWMESSECKIIGPSVISDGLNRLTVEVAIESSSTTVYVSEELTAATPTTAIPVYINGVANTITKIEDGGATGTTKLTVGTAITSLAVGAMVCGQGAGKLGHAVYCTMICGANAYGVTSIEGGGLQMIIHQLGSGGSTDPLNQRATLGWKMKKVAERLVEENMIRVESTCEQFGLTANSN